MLQNKDYKKKFDDYLGSRLKSVEVNNGADGSSAFKPFHSLLKQYDLMLGNKIEKAVESVDYK
jgi:hypothetical protein